MSDGDTRWFHRSPYDLMGMTPAATQSTAGLPRARKLSGSIPAHLARPNSFLSQLRQILAVRERYQLYAARQIAVPAVTSPGLLVMVHELPDGARLQVTALNFGQQAVDEVVLLGDLPAGPVVEMLSGAAAGAVTADGALRVQIDALSGKSFLLPG